MAKPISIQVISDVTDFVTGAKKMGTSLDDFNDDMKDLVRDAKDAGKDLGKGLEKGTTEGVKDAVKDLDKLEPKFREIADASKRESKQMGDSLGKGVKDGTDKGKEGLDEFKDEANSTAKESAASFDGSFESAMDSVQEILANAFAGFGPMGAVAGLALAAGLGAAISAGQDAADAINEAKERAGDLALELYDVGGKIEDVDIESKIREWGVAIDDNREFWEVWQESATSNIDKAQDAAKKAGVDFKTMFRGLSGYDADDAQKALVQTNREIGKLEDKIKDARKSGNPFAGIQDEDGMALDSLRGVAKELSNVRDETKDATKASQALEEATRAETDAAEAAAEAKQQQADAISALQSPIDDAINSYSDFQDKESGAMDPAAYIDGINARIDAQSSFSSNVQLLMDNVGLSAEAAQKVLEGGPDAAAMVAAVIAGGEGIQREYADASNRAVTAGQSIFEGADLNSEVKVDADTKPASDKSDDEARKKRNGEIKVDADTKGAADKINRVADKNYRATVDVVLSGIAEAQRRMDILSRNETKTLTVNVKQNGRVDVP
jgi:hypothetical protein